METTEGHDNKMLDEALALAGKGWPIFPLHTPTAKGGCSCQRTKCASPGKHPRTPKGVKDATTDTATIKKLWGLWRDANIGIATGQASGIVAIDIDADKGGLESWEDLQDMYGRVDTLTSYTGGGGMHLLFNAPEGRVLRNSTGEISNGIDTRAEGGYIIAPPSLHVSGQRYQWEKEE